METKTKERIRRPSFPYVESTIRSDLPIRRNIWIAIFIVIYPVHHVFFIKLLRQFFYRIDTLVGQLQVFLRGGHWQKEKKGDNIRGGQWLSIFPSYILPV